MRAFARISRTIKDHPWSVIAVCLLVTVGLGSGLLFLKGHVTYQSLLPQDFPSVKALSSLRAEFGGISYEYVVVHAPNVTESKIAQALVGLDDSLSKDPRFNSGQLETRKDASGATVPVVQHYVSPFAATMQREMAARGLRIPLSTITSDMVKQFTGKDL
jgi:predicted RND superfamily exporter protein